MSSPVSQTRVAWPRTRVAMYLALLLLAVACDPTKASKTDAGDASSVCADAQVPCKTTGRDAATAKPHKPPAEDEHSSDEPDANSSTGKPASAEKPDASPHKPTPEKPSHEKLDASAEVPNSIDETEPNLDDTANALCGGAQFELLVDAAGAVHVRCNGQDIIIVEPQGGDDDDDNNEVHPTPSGPSATDGESTNDAGAALALCRPVEALEHQRLPARAQAVSTGAGTAAPQAVLVTDLYDKFRGWCGACHVDFSLGDLQVNFSTFTSKVTDDVIEQLRDRSKVMPPGKAFSERAEDDPVVELYHLLKIWRAAADEALHADPTANLKVFFLPSAEQSSDVSPYLMSPSLGSSLTNLGNCIPDAALVNSENVKSKELDDKFAAATTLPKDLRDTDLFNFDSADLARYGVIGYAPTYPLFSDDAGKMRQLRVPRGTTIAFDSATQQFTIPANTRFYKTFLKRVTDKEGNVDRWRKLETRLIVSRPDRVLADGSHEPAALYGTYRWDADEKEAKLVEEPLRNGDPFRDVVFQYLTDEVQGGALLAEGSADVEYDLMTKGWARYYGIPGSQRCVDCHRGGDSQAFILGFGPLQANRLPMDEDPNDGVEQHLHGIYEAPGPDELTQLQRLTDYGIVTGIDEPSNEHEVFPLELTQELPPRTDYELAAQGYMVGNCAPCHNPNGLASHENPVLRDILNFYPSSEGGIFGFPLTGDKAFSPRILRNDGLMRIPYVSPEMLDRERVDPSSGQRQSNKVFGGTPVLAPWRALIYRNVDTPFTYVDDGALFPKMPLHVPGYDPRVRNIMGQWMASLPAREVAVTANDKNAFEQTYEEVFEGDADFNAAVAAAEERLATYREGGRFNCVDYVECKADPLNCGTPCVDTRDIVSHDVLSALRTGQGDYSPQSDAFTFEIPAGPHWVNTDLTEPKLDQWEPRRADWPDVLLGGDVPVTPPGSPYGSATVPTPSTTASSTAPDASTTAPSESSTASNTAGGAGGANFQAQALGVGGMGGAGGTAGAEPAPTDSADPGGAPNTEPSSSTAPTSSETSTAPTTSSSAPPAEPPVDPNDPHVMAANLVRSLRLTDDFRALALGERPMWFWQTEGHDCDFSDLPTPDTYAGKAPAQWLADVAGPLRQGPLYSQSPGEAIFSTICANCHGPQADSKGRQASTVALMSGGETRVANLRNGLFGLGNIETQFGPYTEEAGVTPQDLAVRYVSWMALGGTQRRIPNAVLQLVARSRVYGQRRPSYRNLAVGSPNMLESAARICRELLPSTSLTSDFPFDFDRGLFHGELEFVGGGEQEMWRDLCTYDNPTPLIVLSGVYPDVAAAKWGSEGFFPVAYVKPLSSDRRPTVPADWPVGNQLGETVYGITRDNKTPWCVKMPDETDPAFHDAQVFAYAWEFERGYELPVCPAEVIGLAGAAHGWDDRERWGLRGAANAGMAVFTYLRQVIQEGLVPRPAYDRCELR